MSNQLLLYDLRPFARSTSIQYTKNKTEGYRNTKQLAWRSWMGTFKTKVCHSLGSSSESLTQQCNFTVVVFSPVKSCETVGGKASAKSTFKLQKHWQFLWETRLVSFPRKSTNNMTILIHTCTLSRRIWYPTELPSFSARSSATLCATAMADILLGCVQMMLHKWMSLDCRYWSRINCGTWVVFPHLQLDHV